MSIDKNRSEWLKWRKSGIGSSDAPAIHNKSPYMTALELYEDKFINTEVIQETSSYITERGNILEPIARKLFAAEYNMINGTEETFEPKNFEMAEAPFMRASCDGVSLDGKIGIEIKFQGAEAHENTMKGLIAPHYWIQMQHQMLVAGFDHVFLVSYNPKAENKIYSYKVELDLTFAQEHINACAKFWAREIPEATKDDFVMMRIEGFADKAKKLVELKSAIDEMSVEFDSIKGEIESHITHPKMRVGPVRFTQVVRAGSVDYKAVPELKGINLDQYRKKDSTYYKMTIES